MCNDQTMSPDDNHNISNGGPKDANWLNQLNNSSSFKDTVY